MKASLDLIKRRVVGEVIKIEKGAKPFFHEESWAEIQKTIEACQSAFPLIYGEATDFERQYRLPEPHFSYQLTIDRIAQTDVVFDFAFLGYKYQLSGLKVSKDAFYIYADRLSAKGRFQGEWASVDEALLHLTSALRSTALKPVRTEIELQCKSCGKPFPSGPANVH